MGKTQILSKDKIKELLLKQIEEIRNNPKLAVNFINAPNEKVEPLYSELMDKLSSQHDHIYFFDFSTKGQGSQEQLDSPVGVFSSANFKTFLWRILNDYASEHNTEIPSLSRNDGLSNKKGELRGNQGSAFHEEKSDLGQMGQDYEEGHRGSIPPDVSMLNDMANNLLKGLFSSLTQGLMDNIKCEISEDDEEQGDFNIDLNEEEGGDISKDQGDNEEEGENNDEDENMGENENEYEEESENESAGKTIKIDWVTDEFDTDYKEEGEEEEIQGVVGDEDYINEEDEIEEDDYIIEEDDDTEEDVSTKEDDDTEDEDYSDVEDQIGDLIGSLAGILGPAIGKLSESFSGFKEKINKMEEELDNISEELDNNLREADDSDEDLEDNEKYEDDEDNDYGDEEEDQEFDPEMLESMTQSVMGMLKNFGSLLGNMGQNLDVENLPGDSGDSMENNEDENNYNRDDNTIKENENITENDKEAETRKIIGNSENNRTQENETDLGHENYNGDLYSLIDYLKQLFEMGFNAGNDKLPQFIFLLKNIDKADEEVLNFFQRLISIKLNIPVIFVLSYNNGDLSHPIRAIENRLLRLLLTKSKIDNLGNIYSMI